MIPFLRAAMVAALVLSTAPAGAVDAGGCVVVTAAEVKADAATLSLDVRRHPAGCGCRSKWMVVTLEDAGGTEVGTGRFVLEPDIGPVTAEVPLRAGTGGAAADVSVACAAE